MTSSHSRGTQRLRESVDPQASDGGVHRVGGNPVRHRAAAPLGDRGSSTRLDVVAGGSELSASKLQTVRERKEGNMSDSAHVSSRQGQYGAVLGGGCHAGDDGPSLGVRRPAMRILASATNASEPRKTWSRTSVSRCGAPRASAM